jgi:hypothetical protein
MEKTFDFKEKKYFIKVDVKNVSNDTHYFVDVFQEEEKIRKGHFLKVNEDLQVITDSSNHSFKSTSNDNDLLYAVKKQLINLIS